jgi:phosphoserine phosphatase
MAWAEGRARIGGARSAEVGLMAYAVVATAVPGTLSDRVASRLSQAIREAGAAGVLQSRWLAPGEALEIEVAEAAVTSSIAWREVAVIAGAEGIDLNPIADSGPGRRKRLLVADMESTIIQQEMLDELADLVGLRARVSEITERAMRGELDFEAALNERVGLLAGLDAGMLDRVAGRITLMPGAETLVRTLKASGATCALVSGGFTVFTERVARRLGFAEHHANVLEIADGKLTGRVRQPILGREAKLAALERLTAGLGLQPEATLAVGDGANDLAMLGAAGLGVAFRAKPKVREATAAMPNGAVVTHGDLTALLYLQGYRRDELAA